MNSRNRYVAILAVIGGLSLLMAFISPRFVSTPRVVADPAPRGESAGVVARGVVESGGDVELTSSVKGTVAAVHVREGDRVERGALLLVVDDRKAAALLDEAKSAAAAAEAALREVTAGPRSEERQVASAMRRKAEAEHERALDDLERKRRLFDAEAIPLVELKRAEERFRVAREALAAASEEERKQVRGSRAEQIERARAERLRAESAVRHADALLRDHHVTSPIGGIVTDRFRDPGEGVDVGTPLLRIVDMDRLRIRAELEETDVGKVREGQKVDVTVDAQPGRVFTGSVTKTFPSVSKKVQRSFDPMASFDINTQRIEIALSSYDGLKPGMTVTVRFR